MDWEEFCGGIKDMNRRFSFQKMTQMVCSRWAKIYTKITILALPGMSRVNTVEICYYLAQVNLFFAATTV